ncbi:MAG: penicillin acylase family protein [Rhodothermales bacterium]
MKSILLLLVYLALTGAILFLLLVSQAGAPPLGRLLDPWDGLYRTARDAEPQGDRADVAISGLKGRVEVVRDGRGVPHIYAENDLDAIAALGYVTAQDRLFQMDFLPRVASGRLASAMGPALVDTDRMFRKTGMDWGARRNLERIERAGGIELNILEAYARGFNAYLDGLDEADLPFEFRLLGFKPDAYSPLQSLRVLQYMVYDLTYRSAQSEAGGANDPALSRLYPRYAALSVPIIPERGGQVPDASRRPIYDTAGYPMAAAPPADAPNTLAEGWLPGKGSNNWAVAGARSTTGAPILAGDMHLSLSLPAIWYEVHLVTPSMNSYGVLIPGAPLPVEAFTERLGWAFTNTGADQIDHLALQVDAARRNYLYEGAYRPFETAADTIFVKDGEPVIDSLYYTHWGPADLDGDTPQAIRWVAHDSSRTVRALWQMNRASNFVTFQDALRYWDSPMQNILYADVDGNIAIRSTGYFPLRRDGDGTGMRDGTSDASSWVGRIPFEELPYSYNPEQGYLTSTNQQPADSTYPYYLGRKWAPGYRSLRIDALLGGEERHSVEQIASYQSDVYVVQRDLFAPLFDTLAGLSPRAQELRAMLQRWDGDALTDRPEPLVLDVLLSRLADLTWDEPVFQTTGRPEESQLYTLIVRDPASVWFDRQASPEREQAADILRQALETTVDSLQSRYGWDRARWRWGQHHHVLFRHFTRSEALRPLWRGPYEYPGFASTLSPAGSRLTTHSASWRVVVDFSTQPPTGYGVYPGGPSGNPFSSLYDAQIETYLRFERYPLAKPATAADALAGAVRSRQTLTPR